MEVEDQGLSHVQKAFSVKIFKFSFGYRFKLPGLLQSLTNGVCHFFDCYGFHDHCGDVDVVWKIGI